MTYIGTAQAYPAADVAAPGVAALQRATLWLVGMAGAIVMIEPSPYELAILSALIVFFATGLKLRPLFLPLIFLLLMMNIGYSTAAVYMLDQLPIFNWIGTSWYLALTRRVLRDGAVGGHRESPELPDARLHRRRADRIASWRSPAISISSPAATTSSRFTDAPRERSRIRTCSAPS